MYTHDQRCCMLIGIGIGSVPFTRICQSLNTLYSRSVVDNTGNASEIFSRKYRGF